MPSTISDVMTPSPITLSASSTVIDAARAMREQDIGDVIIVDDRDNVCGIVTDRDITLRVVAEGLSPADVELEQICSSALVTLAPTDTLDDAVRIMRQLAVRRLPVVDEARPVGIVSLGDLAVEMDPDSALAEISASPPIP